MADIILTSNEISKSIPWKRLAQAAGVFFVIIFLVWIVPAGLALYYQNMGGSALQQVINEIDEYQAVTTYCYPPSMTDDQRLALEKARDHLEKSAAIKENYAHTALLLGRANCMLGDTEKSVEAYHRYTELRPDNPLGHVELALAYEVGCNYQRELESNTDNCPQITIISNTLDLTYSQLTNTGLELIKAKQYDKAILWFQRAHILAPQYIDSLYYIGQACEQKKDWEAAINAYENALLATHSFYVKSGDIYFRLGIIYQTTEGYRNINKALSLYKEALKTKAFRSDQIAADAYYQLGEIYFWQEQYLLESIEAYQQSIKLNPKHHWAYFRLGVAHYKNFKDIAFAEERIFEAIVLWPENDTKSIPYRNLGDIYAKAGLIEKAIQAYENALLANPHDYKSIETLQNLNARD